MQTQRIVLSLAVAIAGIGAATSASSQEYRGTWEQQMACTPDVWRLCGDQIPDVRCQPDRGVLAAEHAAALQWLPRGVRIERRTTAGQSRLDAAWSAADGAAFPCAATDAAAGNAAAAETVL